MLKTTVRSARWFTAHHPSSIAAIAGVALLLGGCPPPEGADAGPGSDGGQASRDGGAQHDDAGSVDPDAGASGPDGGHSGEDFTFPYVWPVEQSAVAITPSNMWKNTISADDAFVQQTAYNVSQSFRWVKFTVIMEDPTKVYFQDSQALPFHYDFISAHLDPWVGISREDLNDISLHRGGQELVLGAVLFPPNTGDVPTPEFGIQFVRQDAMHPELVKILYDLVEAAVTDTPSTDDFYFPTFEQKGVALDYAAYFAENGIAISSLTRWSVGDACYVPGWTYGRLRYVAPDDIAAAYSTGMLLHTDILVTDEVPAEVPFVAGIVSFAPTTPNSHVALLAGTYGTPLIYAHDEATIAAVEANLDRTVVLRAETTYESPCAVRVLDAEDIDAALANALLAERAPTPVAYAPKTSAGSLSAATSTLSPSNIDQYGGKASNFSVLQSAVPEMAPSPAVAFSFDLWDVFMAQAHAGSTLGDAIAERLSAHSWPPDFAAMHADLAEIRAWVKDGTFSMSERTSILDALTPFAPTQKVRFRSSTNVEDAVDFVGAGLYESKSGCIADDTDDDDLGPSVCNPDKADERGVFRAMARVYASFYSDNAFSERLRRGVDEDEVGMAILAHHSFPDDDELANGVATFTAGQFSDNALMVTQRGAVSVANPSSSASPEVVGVYVNGESAYPDLTQYSSLVALGEHVMAWTADYGAFSFAFADVAAAWSSTTGATRPFVLDMEYKKMQTDMGEKLVIKQVRPLPVPGNGQTGPTYLFNDNVPLCTAQLEASTVFANHRTKLRWATHVRELVIDDQNLNTSIFEDSPLTYVNAAVDSAAAVTRTGAPMSWAGAMWATEDDSISQSFAFGDDDAWTATVTTDLPRTVYANTSPVRTLSDLYVYFHVVYDVPKPEVSWDGVTVQMVDEDFVRLEPCRQGVPTGSLLHEVDVQSGDVSVAIDMWYPPDPGAAAGYTAPLQAWEQTTLTGLTTTPLTLTDWYAQTFRPEHHNFSEHFLFEPGLDPGLSATQRAELVAADVWQVYVLAGYMEGVISLRGFDGTFRTP